MPSMKVVVKFQNQFSGNNLSNYFQMVYNSTILTKHQEQIMAISANQIENYLNHIKARYAAFHSDMGFSSPEMITRFNDSVRVSEGKNYIKVIKDGSVHSFIVKNDGDKFKEGDVLKAASWNAPAKNFARGNIITGELSKIDWSM